VRRSDPSICNAKPSSTSASPSVVTDIGPDHPSFKFMLLAYARAMRAAGARPLVGLLGHDGTHMCSWRARNGQLRRSGGCRNGNATA
jgi:hypothetical protein